jgi:hypothetical protein
MNDKPLQILAQGKKGLSKTKNFQVFIPPYPSEISRLAGVASARSPKISHAQAFIS